MKFVKADELKAGMRLAKPIYNRNGVLLYDRNSRLTHPAINSIKNFGLIGIFILEPAEPVPPLSREDIEFEQCQTIYLFQLRELMEQISKRQPIDDVNRLVEDILKRYGTLDHRVNFNQNLRSAEDFMYKHAISTAILVAMITCRMGYTHQRQSVLVTAALLYDYGYSTVPKGILEKGTDLTQGDQDTVQLHLEKGLDQLLTYKETNDLLGRSVSLMMSYIYSFNPERSLLPDEDLKRMGWIMRVADDFDRMTAMNLGSEPVSEIVAMQNLFADPSTYNAAVVNALAESIHIVPSSANVDLTNGDKGIVLVENPTDFMHPVILRFSDNQIYDLSDPSIAKEIQIKDIMKTMDNRIAVDEETLQQFVPDERLQKITEGFRKHLAKANAQE
jgi:hypothetical protein